MSELITFGRASTEPDTTTLIKKVAHTPYEELVENGTFLKCRGTEVHVARPLDGPSWPESADGFVAKLSGFGSGVRGHHIVGAQIVAEALGLPVISLEAFPQRGVFGIADRRALSCGDFRPYVRHMVKVVATAQKAMGATRVDRMSVLGGSLGAAMAPMFGCLAERLEGYNVLTVAAQSPCSIEHCRSDQLLRRVAETERSAYAASLLSAPELQDHIQQGLGLPRLVGAGAVELTLRAIKQENTRKNRANPELVMALVRGFAKGEFLRDLSYLLTRSHVKAAVAYGVSDGLFTESAQRALQRSTSKHPGLTVFALEGDHSMWGRPHWVGWFATNALGRLAGDKSRNSKATGSDLARS